MLTKERIAEFRAAPNSVAPLDFVLLCQQAEEAIDLLEQLQGTVIGTVEETLDSLSEKHTSISDSEGVEGE